MKCHKVNDHITFLELIEECRLVGIFGVDPFAMGHVSVFVVCLVDGGRPLFKD